MGISGIVERLQIVHCGHCGTAKAFWNGSNDGKNPPDLYYTDFPTKGRIMMLNKTLIVACFTCRDSLEVIREQYGKFLQ